MRDTILPYDCTAHSKLLTVPKVMEMLNCSRSFVYKLIFNGDLKCLRLGDKKGLRVFEKSLNQYVSARCNCMSRK